MVYITPFDALLEGSGGNRSLPTCSLTPDFSMAQVHVLSAACDGWFPGSRSHVVTGHGALNILQEQTRRAKGFLSTWHILVVSASRGL